MKLSEYPILGSPSADAVVPVIDGGENYTYPLSSLGSGGGGGGYSVTLASDTASIPLPLLDKGKHYALIIDGAQSVEVNTSLFIDGITSVNQYETRYTFSYSGGVITGYNSTQIGIALFSPPPNSLFCFEGIISLVGRFRMSGTVQREENASNLRPAITTRVGRCITDLSSILDSQIQLTLATESGVIRAGTQIKIKEF